MLNPNDRAAHYRERATDIRRRVLALIHKAQTSHIGSNLSCIDLLTVLYGNVKNLDNNLLPYRDRVIYSKGWAAASAYTFLFDLGIITQEELDTYGKDGGLLGLTETNARGIEASTGSMGHGLPIGVGMALAAKRSGEDWHTYVLMSDGEMNCGTTWESALLGAHHKLHNLTVIVDKNEIQAMGRTDEVLNLGDLAAKWRAFDWEVRSIDGHDYDEIEKALTVPHDRPLCIIAHTTKGKGVSFMENKLEWHYKNISVEDYQNALQEL